MNYITKFGARRKYIAVLLAAMCLVFVACGGDKPAEDGTGSVSETTEDTANARVTDNDNAETGVTADSEKNEPAESITAVDGEPVITDNTTGGADELKEPEENVSVTDKNEPAGTDTKPAVTDETNKTDKPVGTSAAVTTEVTVKVLPDGGIVLPDDEW